MGWLLLVFVRFGRGTLAAFRDRESRPLVVAVLLLLAAGTIVYNQLEGWSLLDSLYFTVVSLTTVGYGDLAPRTAAGKIFTMIYLISGVSLLLAFINLVAQRGSSRPLLRRMRGQGLDRSEDDQAKG